MESLERGLRKYRERKIDLTAGVDLTADTHSDLIEKAKARIRQKEQQRNSKSARMRQYEEAYAILEERERLARFPDNERMAADVDEIRTIRKSLNELQEEEFKVADEMAARIPTDDSKPKEVSEDELSELRQAMGIE